VADCWPGLIEVRGGKKVCLPQCCNFIGSVLHAKLTAWIGGAWSGAGHASTGSGRTKAGMVRFAK
jgi:hypothetical protein